MARFVDAFKSPRLLLMVGLGFASGLPNPLTGSTLTAWLSDAGVGMAAIGAAALLQLPYNFKFVWAWLLDRYVPRLLGRRRGWMLIFQVTLLVAILVMSLFDPLRSPFAIGALALVIAFVSASQDIAIDAYRTELLRPAERASGTAVFVASYRGALIVAGAVALVLSDHLSWNVVYALLALMLGVGIVTTLLAPEPEGTPPAPRAPWQSLVGPFSDLLGRRRAWALLLIVALYKIGDSVAGHVQIPFLGAQHLHFSNTEIGVVKKGIGLAATIVGALLGGGLVARFGLRRSLIAFGVLQAAPNALYAWLAVHARDQAMIDWLAGQSWARALTVLGVSPETIPMAAVITVDELMNGLGTAAFVALLMYLCNKKFTAMQYALLSSLSNIVGRLLASSSGVLAVRIGWPSFFGLTVALAAPAIVLLMLVDLSEPVAPPREEKAA